MDIILSPFTTIIKFLFGLFLSVTQNPAFSTILLSVAISILLFPLFAYIERLKQRQNILQQAMRDEIDEINAVYKGLERYCYTKEIHKIHGYSSATALVPSLGLLVQIPFLLAAYYYLSGFTGFQGAGFLYVSDLSQADTICHLGRVPINLLPFLMTAVNIYSGWLYGRDGKPSERYQYMAVALVFLVLLYNAAASVLLYWTLSNILALVRIVFFQSKFFMMWQSRGNRDVRCKKRVLKNLWCRAVAWPIAVALYFVLVVFMSAIGLYYANISDYGTQLRTIVAILLPLASIALLCIVVVLVLARKHQIYAIALIVAVATLFSIQTNIINWDYGVLAGEDLLWGSYRTRLVVDLLIWLTGIGCFVVFARKLRPYLNVIMLVVLLAQLGTVIKAKRKSPPVPSHQNFTICHKEKFNFSEKQNIVIIILDSFQNDIFQEIIDKHPKYRYLFSGFTYYRNTTAQYAKTYGAVPALLTGQWYENQEPIQDFMMRSYATAVTTKLKQKGWKIHFYPVAPRLIAYSTAYIDNIVASTAGVESFAETGKFLDTAFFSGSPHFIKPVVYNRAEGQMKRLLPKLYKLSSSNTDEGKIGVESVKRYQHPVLEFIDEASQKLVANNQEPTFKYYHFNIPHAPFILNEKLQQERLSPDRRGFRRFSIAALEATLAFLDKLRAEGLYDNTTVFILGDHGGGKYYVGRYDTDEIKVEAGDVPDEHLESGIPLLLAKPFNATGELSISDAAVSLGDVPYTISDLTETDYNGRGINIFKVGNDDNIERERRFLFYTFICWRQDYLPTLREYIIKGHAWSPASWHKTGKVFEYNPEDIPKQNFEMGREYCFDGIDPLGVLNYGWSQVEDEGVWSCRHEASLMLKLPRKHNGAVFSFLLRPATRSDGIKQEVSVFTHNDLKVANWQINQTDWFKLVLPVGNSKQDEMLIKMVIPYAQSPFDAGLGSDRRELGVFLRSIKISELPLVKPGEAIDMTLYGNACGYLLNGWGEPEKKHRWSTSKVFGLGMRLHTTFKTGATLSLYGAPILYRGLDKQSVKINMNGENVGSWDMTKGAEWYEVDVPEYILNGERALSVEFEISNPVRPCDISASSDGRLLGIAVEKIILK